MDDGENLDPIGEDTIVDVVRVLGNSCPSDVPLRDGVQLGHVADSIESFLDPLHEPRP